MQFEHSNETQVLLTALDLDSSGRYRCEVSAEAPSFQTVSDHGDMVTVGECRIFVYSMTEATSHRGRLLSYNFVVQRLTISKRQFGKSGHLRDIPREKGGGGN